MKTIIAGSRNIKEYSIVKQAIRQSGFEITEVVSGMAPGVDSLAEDWAIENNIEISPYPAQWEDLTLTPCYVKYNKFGKPYNVLAGHNRNEQMAKYADALIAIWDGKSPGTKNMIELAKKYNLKIYIYNLMENK